MIKGDDLCFRIINSLLCSFAAVHGLHASRYALASPYSCYTPGLAPPPFPGPQAPPPPEVKLPSVVTSHGGNQVQTGSEVIINQVTECSILLNYSEMISINKVRNTG